MSSGASKKKEKFEIKKQFLMHFVENRLHSYKNWPFQSDCSCVPEKMAAAGFYHDPSNLSPDSARCFVCQKELEGWEPDDDPWEEHKSHAPQCEYLKLKNPEDPTTEEFFKLECSRQQNIMEQKLNKRITEFEAYASEARKELVKLQDG